jgi:SAM domain (Sterile alpha motif)
MRTPKPPWTPALGAAMMHAIPDCRCALMDIVVWLRSLGLGKYEAAFRENEIDDTVLPNLTTEDLKENSVRRHSSGSSTSLLRCVLIIREPRGLLFFSHRRTLNFKGVLKAPREFNFRPASTTADRCNPKIRGIYHAGIIRSRPSQQADACVNRQVHPSPECGALPPPTWDHNR